MVAPIVLPGKPVQASIPCITLKNILLRDTIRFAAVVVDQVQELFVNCSATALGIDSVEGVYFMTTPQHE